MRGVTNPSLVSQQGTADDLATEGGRPKRPVNLIIRTAPALHFLAAF